MQTLSQKLLAHFVTVFDREDGQTMAEYGVILAVITAAIITALVLLSGQILAVLTRVANAIA